MKNTNNKKIKDMLEKNNLYQLLINKQIKINRKGILTMKSFRKFAAIALSAAFIYSGKTNAQDDFNKVFVEAGTQSYQPLTNTFSSDINAGLYHTAKIEKKFSLYFGVKGASTEVIEAPSGLKMTSVPFAVPQISASAFATEVTFRFMPAIHLGKYGSVKMAGGTLRHSFTQFIKKSPVDAAVLLSYQSLKVRDSKDADIVNVQSISAGMQVSKTWSVITIYTGIQYQSTGADYSTNYNGGSYKQHYDNQNKMSGTLGMTLKLGPLTLNGDYSAGKNNSVSTGFGFSF